MTDHKFTDDDVIKGLKCLSGAEIFCRECAFGRLESRGFACKKNVAEAALDLLHRQKAEIESLQKSLVDQFDGYENIRKKAKAEAIKEFAERLKEKLGWTTEPLDEYDIDNLVEEMTRDGNVQN